MIKLTLSMLLVFTLNSQANTPIWVKDSSTYIKDGEITLKRENGSDFNINLNHKNVTRESQARTPNIMIVSNSSGSYSWSHGFKMNSDSYLIYESALETYIEFSQAQMRELFDYEEEPFNKLAEEYRYSWPTKRVTYSATFTCGNNDYSGSCRYSSNVSGEGYGSYTQGSSFPTGFSYTMNAYSDNVYGSFSVPESFKDAFGDKVNSSASCSTGLYGQCSDTDGSGSTCNRSVSATSSLQIGYTFIENWRGSGVRVGAYRWYKCYGGSASIPGMFVVGEKVANVPITSFSDMYISASASQIVYLLGGDLYSFTPGENPSVAISGAPSLPVSAININGVKNEIDSPPPRFPRPRARFGNGIEGVA